MKSSADTKGLILGVRRSSRELADGTCRVQIDIEPRDKLAFYQQFPDHGDPIVLARVKDEALLSALRGEMAQDRQWGKYARELKLGGFFRRPDVWKAIGTDAQFLDYVRGLSACLADPEDMRERYCEGGIEPAHVRRVKDGSGTAVKPPFSAVPMCRRHHRLQHDKGESAVGGREHLDKARIDTVEAWAWNSLKEDVGVDSMANLDPAILAEWAKETGVFQFLPECYREAA